MDDKQYEELNDAINKVFFDGRHQDSPVYLDLEEDLQLELAKSLSIDPCKLEQEIGHRVLNTLRLDKGNVYTWHRHNLIKWYAPGTVTPPPFIALLLTLSAPAVLNRGTIVSSGSSSAERIMTSPTGQGE